jgi:hypothetical protein
MILYLFLTFLFTPGNNDPKSWIIKTNEPNYRVLVRESDHTGIKEIKIVHKFKGNFKKLIVAMNDIKTNEKLFSNCAKANLLKQLDAHNSYQYFYFKMPITVADRDIISKVTIYYNDSSYSLVSHATDSKLIAKNVDVIRIHKANTSWQFRKTGNGEIIMEYYASADPGGSIPKWLVNALAIRESKISIEKLKKMMN